MQANEKSQSEITFFTKKLRVFISAQNQEPGGHSKRKEKNIILKAENFMILLKNTMDL